MATIVRKNERSWAIELISEINIMFSTMELLIKKAGGESTLSTGRISMFPDVLLYADSNQTQIMQGWELKLPDTPITNQTFIKDAERKARSLGLNSFFIWNFTSGVLYVKNSSDIFEPIKSWNGTNYIKTRADVITYKNEWLPIIKEIVLQINDFFETGKFKISQLGQVISDNLLLSIIERNQAALADYLRNCSIRDATIRSKLNLWWEEVKVEYIADENDMFSAYSKVTILRWINRITFGHLVKKYYNTARKVDMIDTETTPQEANEIFIKITAECDFYSVFAPFEFDELLNESTWCDLVDMSLFLKENGLVGIEHDTLQDILENTVTVSKREIRGQFTTPLLLAKFLAKATILDWTGNCIDPCCGTGSIAKAILDEKIALTDVKKAYETTWASDKFSFPLQISNISLTRADAMNLPCKIFQSNVFALKPGNVIDITNPQDGSTMHLALPKYNAIVSNLPFVPFEIITEDEKEYIAKMNEKITSSGGSALDGRGDIYSYIIFSLWNMLDTNGRLGVIVSNSWLATEWGEKLLEELPYYYNICNVIISGSGKWFDNADVVTTILILEKKDYEVPNKDSTICFSVINKSLNEFHGSSELMDKAIDSIILSNETDADIVRVKKYTLGQVKRLLNLGISKNALFNSVDWLDAIGDKLVPISDIYNVSRGERRGQNALFYPEAGHGIENCYIKPVLKNPKNLKGLVAKTDIEAFCCSNSTEDLITKGHNGALRWIRKFENVTNGTGKLLPQVLSRANGYWYEMANSAKADMVTILNPNERLFVAKFDEPTFVDQRFTRINRKSFDTDVELGHALLNSILGMFYIEAIGFGRGLGVLDTSSTNFKKIFMLNPKLIDSKQREAIINSFKHLIERQVKNTMQEIEQLDRVKFDKIILESYGILEYYEAIKQSLVSMQKTRLSVKRN